MQSLTWYTRRLGRMTPGEMAWRARSILRDLVDRCLLGLRQRQRELPAILEPGATGDRRGFRVTDMAVGEWSGQEVPDLERTWCERLLAEADRIAAHRLSFFDLQDYHLGDPIDWHRDHKAGKRPPMVFAPFLDYRDFDRVGDAKFVWAPNRHHQFVVLGRAYRASGDVRYAAAVVEQLEAWLRQNPYGVGMNWRSPLELAIRLINWVWALDLILESGLVEGEFRDRLYDSVYAHLWEITRKYSRGSSANNHAVGEAAGVFIATTYFRDLKNASQWRAGSRDILCQEIREQTYDDGGNREQALGYHLFVLQFFVVAGIAARSAGDDLPAAFWSRLRTMFEFAGAVVEGGTPPPMFGDCDDGCVLDLGTGPGDVQALLAVGALLFDRPEFKTGSGGYCEPARWLLGRASRERFEAMAGLPGNRPIRSRAFRDTGYYLLQYGHQDAADRISVVFDCGELGFKSIAAHGHADALSFTLRAFGAEVLVDPGTYDYFTYPAWRDYFRSTRAHNTVVVDGEDQSVMLGPFMWGKRARARCVCWEPNENGGTVAGEHDGYRRLPDPVIHGRTIALDGPARRLIVQDDISAQGRHEIATYLHLAEHCRITHMDANRCEVDVGPGTVTIQIDERLSVRTLSGSEEPIGGWVSRGLHRRAAATTLVGSGTFNGPISLKCQIEIGGCSGC